LTWKVRGAGVYFTFTSYTKKITYRQPFIAFGDCPYSNDYHIINTQVKTGTPDFSNVYIYAELISKSSSCWIYQKTPNIRGYVKACFGNFA
jgi:hypothetical protein